jgi:hypothetical protein
VVCVKDALAVSPPWPSINLETLLRQSYSAKWLRVIAFHHVVVPTFAFYIAQGDYREVGTLALETCTDVRLGDLPNAYIALTRKSYYNAYLLQLRWH